MSVIPFILDGDNKTVVENEEDYYKAGGPEGKVIWIKNLDTKQLDTQQLLSTKSSNATYDLRVGREYRDHKESGKHDLLDNGKISLQPGAAVIIETEEEFKFPKTRFGHVVPKVSLLQDGLSNTSSKIDPGYGGKLSITVFNLGKRTVELKKGDPFCTIYILDVQEGVIPYDKDAKKIVGNYKKGFLSDVRDFIESNQAYFTIVLTIVTIILTVVQTIQLLRPPEIQMNNKENTVKNK